MEKNQSILTQNKIFFSGLAVVLFAGALFILIDGKAGSFLSLNSYHPFFLNVFFINYTFMGDGIFACCPLAVIFFYFKKRKLGFAMLYAFLLSGIAAQVLKNLVNSPRPKIYFEAGTYLHFIDGVTLSGSSGFPSGHTATAFAIATVFALMLKNKNWQFFILPAALLVGYSRIYLAQHFVLDVLAGAFLGSLSGILAYYLALNRIHIRRSIKKMHQVPSASPLSTHSSIQTA